MPRLARRAVIRAAVQLLPAAAIMPWLSKRAQAAESCVAPASEALRSTLHYAAKATNPREACGACGFFAKEDSEPGCGNCMILEGPVDATGHCDSWAARV
jgi:hypothetical protein